MRLLRPAFDTNHFFAALRDAPERLLVVDYDGTLAPFNLRPESAVPYPGVALLLDEIVAGATRVILVSGRKLDDLQGPLAHVPACDVWAAHGWQRARAGRAPVEFQPGSRLQRALDAAERSSREVEMLGARVERKPGSIAVHWRGLGERSAALVRQELASRWPAYHSLGLQSLPFDGGAELRSPTRTKATAVKEILAGAAPRAVCAYLGDDLTDEDAFTAIQGRGMAVLVHERLRATRADVWIQPPQGLIDFLRRWRDCTRPS